MTRSELHELIERAGPFLALALPADVGFVLVLAVPGLDAGDFHTATAGNITDADLVAGILSEVARTAAANVGRFHAGAHIDANKPPGGAAS